MIFIYFLCLIVSFAVLFKCADWFVEGASGIAMVLNIPKMIVGIVFVGLATTAPEFGVSVQAAFLGHPEIALGNAIGSVICDDGIALGLAAVLAPTAILVNCRILRTAAIFLISVDVLTYFFAWNGTLGRWEGAALLLLLCGYFLFILRKRRDLHLDKTPENLDYPGPSREDSGESKISSLKKPLFLFIIGIGGVVLTSRVVIWAAIHLAEYFSVSETIIGLTVVAVGTSLPEISTCIAASVKNEGEIAVGNIIGADVLNILWIIGVSSLVNPIMVELRVINFVFPFMILIVAVMLLSIRIHCRLTRPKGILLFLLYVVYIFLTIRFYA